MFLEFGIMKKYVSTLFILSWVVFAYSSDVYPCYKPEFGWTQENKIKAFGHLGMAYCLGVKDDLQHFVFQAIEEGYCRNSPKIINAQEAFNEIKKYIGKPKWIEHNQHLEYNDVRWCFSLYDKVEYHNKIQEIFYKYCKDCK